MKDAEVLFYDYINRIKPQYSKCLYVFLLIGIKAMSLGEHGTMLEWKNILIFKTKHDLS